MRIITRVRRAVRDMQFFISIQEIPTRFLRLENNKRNKTDDFFIYTSGRLSFANGIDATHEEELYLRRVLH